MDVYSNEEMSDIHLMYGLANCNRAEARRLYSEHFPNRRLPCERTFVRLDRRLRETGSFKTQTGDRGRPRSRRTLDLEERVLAHIDENPQDSTRKMALSENVDHMTVWRILRSQQLYPYHVQRVQALSEIDYAPRRRFCNEMLHKIVNYPNFLSNILYTDEAGFNRNGIINFHNNHHWAEENPHIIVNSRFQHTFSVNVWAGIVGDSLIGPIFLPNRLNGQHYLYFLQNVLPIHMEDIPLDIRDNMWFMHDGAPCHFSNDVRQFLNNLFHEKWIGRGGPLAWPARSPDLNPIDFYLWGHVKNLVYSTPTDSEEDLRRKIIAVFQQIKRIPGVFERMRHSMRRRLNMCVAENGAHVEHLL